MAPSLRTNLFNWRLAFLLYESVPPLRILLHNPLQFLIERRLVLVAAEGAGDFEEMGILIFSSLQILRHDQSLHPRLFVYLLSTEAVGHR